MTFHDATATAREPLTLPARLLAWVAPLWIAGVGWRYVGLIADSYTRSGHRQDVGWLIGWTVVAVLALVSVALVSGRALLPWTLLTGVGALVLIVRSGVGVSAVAAAWLITLSILVGDRILDALGLTFRETLFERMTIALCAGIITLTFATFALGAIGLLSPRWIWTSLLALTVLETRHALALLREIRVWFGTSSRPDRERSVLILLTGFAMVGNLVSAVAPEVGYDSLNYHLSAPRFYLEAGRLIDLPYFFHSYFAHLAEMFYALCMALGGGMTAKLANYGIGIASMAGVYCLGAMVFTRRVAQWAAAFYYTTPMTGSLSGTASTDLWVVLFLTASIIALLRWGRSNQGAWIALSGAMAGCAVGVKLNALYGVIGLSVATVVMSLRMTATPAVKIRNLFLFGLLVAATATPWYVPAFIHTGNPAFPLLNGIFKSPRTDPVNNLMDSRAFGVGTAPNALLELPARLTFNPRFGTPPGTLGVLALFCAPFGIILLARRNREIRMLGLVAGVYMAFWAATFQYSRYYMPMLPLVAVLGVAGLLLARHTSATERITRFVMLILLITQGALSSLRYEQFPKRFPIEVALGIETREAFLERELPGYSGAQVINKGIRPGQRVAGVETEHLRFYLDAPIDVMSEALADHPLRTIGGPEEEVARGLANAGYAYIFVTHTARTHPQPWNPYTYPQFLNRFATLEFDGDGTAVYKLKRESGP